MNPWSQLLESFHSALIDELTDKHPEPKPELELPIPQTDYSAPESTSSVLACVVTQEKSRGVALLALDEDMIPTLALSATALWAAILCRAEREFSLRGIHPKLDAPILLAANAPLPADFPSLKRVIWIPFRIPAGACYLGVGI